MPSWYTPSIGIVTTTEEYSSGTSQYIYGRTPTTTATYTFDSSPVTWSYDVQKLTLPPEEKHEPGHLNVGDRITGIGSRSGVDLNGRLGTIIDVTEQHRNVICVQFDEENDYFHNGEGKGPLKSCFYVKSQNLILLQTRNLSGTKKCSSILRKLKNKAERSEASK